MSYEDLVALQIGFCLHSSLDRYNTTMIWKAWTLSTVAVVGRMSQQQQEVIAYLREENRILREKLGRKRILLSIEQKRRLATKGKSLGRYWYVTVERCI